MEKFIKGEIVVVPFPFSDLSQSKRRPAFVIREFNGGDTLLCQITSKAFSNEYAIQITDKEFKSGSLNRVSNIRTDKIFTCSKNIILYKVGKLNDEAVQKVTKSLIKSLNNQIPTPWHVKNSSSQICTNRR